MLACSSIAELGPVSENLPTSDSLKDRVVISSPIVRLIPVKLVVPTRTVEGKGKEENVDDGADVEQDLHSERSASPATGADVEQDLHSERSASPATGAESESPSDDRQFRHRVDALICVTDNGECYIYNASLRFALPFLFETLSIQMMRIIVDISCLCM
tara:strand:- start:62 stop:538 length:477 start_codon:yes stop_codon:yes gene_type:complete